MKSPIVINPCGLFSPNDVYVRARKDSDRPIPRFVAFCSQNWMPQKMYLSGAYQASLTSQIARVARRETAYREIGAMIDAERLATNLLSSMPLTFNLLAPWMQVPERASGYLRELLPAFEDPARLHSRGYETDKIPRTFARHGDQ
jgi:hypothetical protein